MERVVNRLLVLSMLFFGFVRPTLGDTCNWVPYSPQVVETTAACGDGVVRRATCVGAYYCTRSSGGNGYYGMCAVYRPATPRGCEGVTAAYCIEHNDENIEITSDREYRDLLRRRGTNNTDAHSKQK